MGRPGAAGLAASGQWPGGPAARQLSFCLLGAWSDETGLCLVRNCSAVAYFFRKAIHFFICYLCYKNTFNGEWGICSRPERAWFRRHDARAGAVVL